MVACAKLPTQIISDFGNSAVAQLFWDPDFCLNKNDGDKFPYPNNCWEYFICQNGRLNFGECAWPQLFDPFRGTCDDSHNVVCLNADQGGTHDPLCPAPGSDDLVFLPAKDCEFYYICVNGHPVLTFCRPGEHWNMWDEFCDTPGNAGCDVSSLYRLLCFKLKSFFPQPCHLLCRFRIARIVSFHFLTRTTAIGLFTVPAETDPFSNVSIYITLTCIKSDVCFRRLQRASKMCNSS